MNKYKKTGMLVVIIVIAILMIIDISFYLSGSSELYPTEEQEEKVKMVTGILFSILFVIEAVFVVLYRKVNT